MHLSSPEPQVHKVGLKYTSRAGVCESVCQCVSMCVSVSTLSNMNFSKTSGPIAIKFYLKHHWGRGMAALRFGSDRIGTLVSMATNISHRVIWEKML